MRPLIPFALLAVAVLCGAGRDGDEVDFLRDVQPILAARCYECHGPEKQKAGLRLDRRAAALAGAWDGEEPVILSGRGAESPLVLRTRGLDDDDRMPPKGPPLEPDQVELLQRWIDQGAHWPDGVDSGDDLGGTHWAYQRPRRPPLPEVGDSTWCRNAIDRFVLARLESEGLTPSPEAEPGTLLRRVSLDLTGLPPEPEDLAAFLADDREHAYERAVERLLASPAYAEHMARNWLDLARYADTNGYEKDERRSNWRWRDWVIEAFAQDLPFDQFTIQQFAGDLLEHPEVTALATGFHRNTMTNMEGGADPEEFRVAAVVDRVNTLASTWLGTTMACAQCHNHKYDPFSQREYFELYAFFDSTADTGNANAPEWEFPLPGQREALQLARARESELEAELDAPWPAIQAERAAWETRMRALQADPTSWDVAVLAAHSTRSGAELASGVEGVLTVTGEQTERDVYTLDLAIPAGGVRALRLEALAERDAGPGRAQHGNFVLSGIELQGPDGTPVAIARASASFSQTGFAIEQALDADPHTGWAVSDGTRARAGEAWFVLAEALAPGSAGSLRVVLRFESTYARHVLGRLRLATSGDARAAEWAGLPFEVRAALTGAPSPDSAVIESTTEGYYKREHTERGRALVERLTAARVEREAAQAAISTAMVLQELPEPRTTHVMVRGSFLVQGDVVERDVPGALNPWPQGVARDRLGLAQWLVDPAHPLTARVTVNRLWERLFARGLVATLDDFGTRGEAPTHPELLDWLALEFVEGGWSVKQLLRTLVTSATYRQSSRVTPGLLERDPQNLLLARAPRPRLEAEVLRDSALAVAGLLDRRVGGESAFPPQPEGVWASTYSAERWETAGDRSRWRRGLYTFIKRTAPYPSHMLFDGTSRELACVRRGRSNTPLQALVLLNDPGFFEAAMGLARRVLLDAPADGDARIAHAYRCVLAREPEARERELLSTLLAQERARFAADPLAARELIATDTPMFAGDLDSTELAAWTVAANVLLNLDEFVTRE